MADPAKPGSSGGRWADRRAANGEQLGAGVFVHRRGTRSGRIRPARLPFEHATVNGAIAEAEKLARQNPGQTFEVFARLHSARRPAEQTPAEDTDDV